MVNKRRPVLLGVQALLLFLAWSLACVSLAGGSSNTKSVKNASWFKHESGNLSVYCNLWGCCVKDRISETCTAHDDTTVQHDKKSPILAMSAFAWLCTSAFFVVCLLNLLPTQLHETRGALLDKLGVGLGCSAWLWGVACWAQATTGDFRPSQIGALEPIVWGVCGLEAQTLDHQITAVLPPPNLLLTRSRLTPGQPGFGATVTSWLFVMACTGLSAACLLVDSLKAAARKPSTIVVDHMRMPDALELRAPPPLVTGQGGPGILHSPRW